MRIKKFEEFKTDKSSEEIVKESSFGDPALVLFYYGRKVDDESSDETISRSFGKKVASYFGVKENQVSTGFTVVEDKNGEDWVFKTMHMWQEDVNMSALENINNTRYAPQTYWLGSGRKSTSNGEWKFGKPMAVVDGQEVEFKSIKASA